MKYRGLILNIIDLFSTSNIKKIYFIENKKNENINKNNSYINIFINNKL